MCADPLGNQIFNMQVVQLKPQGAVRIVDQNVQEHFRFEVDFEPAPDLADEDARKAFNARILDKLKKDKATQESNKLALEERRQAGRRRAFEEMVARTEEAAGTERGDFGEIEVTMRLPDGKAVLGKFHAGAPAAAVQAVVLRSEWAQANCPWGVQLQEAAPPRRKLGAGDGCMTTVTRELHRSALLVRPQEPAEEDLVTLAQEVPTAEPPAPAPPRSPQKWHRSATELQRNTLQAALVMAWRRTGLEDEEARRRAQAGEIPPRGPQAPPAVPVPEEAPRLEQEAMVEQFRNVIGWVSAEDARSALERASWNLEGAMNAYLEGGGPAAVGGGTAGAMADGQATASLVAMGFQERHAQAALRSFRNDIDQAANFLLTNMDDLDVALANLS